MDEYISREAAVDAGYLSDWYIASVGNESPVWTDEHIDELLNDFIVIPKDTPAIDVQPVNQWISVKDRLPDEVEAEVLVWIEDGTADDIKIYNSLHIAYWYGDTKLFYDFHCDEIKGVTHWMYVSAIPEPTKDGDTE